MNIGTKGIKRKRSKMKKSELEKIILETYSNLLEVDNDERQTKGLDEIPPALRKSIEKRYGVSKWPDKDFLSSDMKTYFKTSNVDGTTGNVGHKVINLPSFEGMYKNFSDIIGDIRSLMNNQDVRTDKNARELFELIKTNFRKLQRYLRTERPDQYELMKMRRQLSELYSMFKEHGNLIKEEVKYINESMLDEVEDEEEPQPEEEPDTDAPEETVLEDATDKILGKFPTVRAAIVKLQTEDFKEFVESIDWISPRPSSFRINLKNGQDYILKWTGKTFQAQIMGKRYLLSNIADYQQALDKLSLLYREAPMTGAGEGEPADVDSDSGGGGGGGDFPGADDAGGGEDLGGDDIAADDEGGADLTDEPVDFEDPGEEPEA